MTEIDLSGYIPEDSFFGAPFLDEDEQRESPAPYRYLHGGFTGTDTRFSFCYPPAEVWRGRLLQPLEGANAGHENVNTGPLGAVTGGLEMAFRLGGYTVESNMGHMGDVMDAKAGPDPTIYGWRAAAETARFSKYVAAQLYGHAPRYSYVFGGSGGARRSPLCLEYAPGVWDGALPYMGDAQDGEHGDLRLLRGATPNFSSMFNVQRLLGEKIYQVMDAMWPGGSGDPFTGLDTHQREELAALYRLGFPRGDEFMIAQPMGQMWLWTSMASAWQEEDAAYFENFWTTPGHVGHDQPGAVEHDLIDVRTTVVRALYPKELLEEEQFSGDDFARMRSLAAIFADMQNMWGIPMAVELADVPTGYRPGAGLKLLTGEAAGRQLYNMSSAGNVFLASGGGEAANLRFSGVAPGDEVQLSNRAFLAYCYYYRHHLWDHVEYDSLRVDGTPVHQQYPHPEMSPFMGVVHSATYEGKLMWVHHTHDASLWPPQGLGYKNNVERVHGVEGAAEKFRLRWTENAEHVPPFMAASPPGRANTTWLVDYQPVIEQSLVDLMSWVEDGVAPAGTSYEYRDGKVHLPDDAAARGGIQPVLQVTADGGARAEVAVGSPVTLTVRAQVPPGAGTVVSLRWDFDGTGSYPETAEVDGTSADLTLSTTHSYDAPGTYFATALVESHREGDVAATSRRIPNVASARVVVT